MATADRGTLLRSAMRAGAILGGAKIAILGIAYLAFGVGAVVSAATGVLLWFVTIGILVGAAFRLKRETGAYQPFLRALFHLVMTWAIGQALYTVFSILLFHVLDPSLLESTVEPMREITRKANERMKTPPAEIEALVGAITKDTSPFSVANQLRGYGTSLLPGVVLSAIIAIPFRARPEPPPAA
jgi:hypothetical protein